MTDVQDINSTNRQYTQETLSQQETDELDDWTIIDLSDTSDTQSEHSEFDFLSDDSQDNMCNSGIEQQDEVNQLANQWQNIQVVNLKLIPKVADYTTQCRFVCDNHEQHYINVRTICQQYSTDLLNQLSSYKTQEWYVLEKILKKREMTSWKVPSNPLYMLIVTQAWKDTTLYSESLKIYAQQCHDLLKHSQQYYKSIRVVGQNCTLEALQQLIIHKDREWQIICEILTERKKMVESIYLNINSIKNLIAPISPVDWYVVRADLRAIGHQFTQRKWEFVFGAGTAEITRYFARTLTVEKLNAFASCMMFTLKLMQEIIDYRCNKQSIRKNMQDMIQKRLDMDSIADILTASIEVTFYSVGCAVNNNHVDMAFSCNRKRCYRSIFADLDTTSLLLIHDYMQAMQQEIMTVVLKG